ncbi:MAG: lipocalin-like domain-containing protein [Pseudoprimorskyibacter sp.]|nr:lipocalin-like domain-containing protein [Pseudoprimorskyibacter sp.]
MIARCLIVVLSWIMAEGAAAQGFGGLGTAAEGFAIPDSSYRMVFPDDHGPHPDFRIEWWYLTANLTGQDGASYGVQWTLFRSAFAPGSQRGWTSPQIWFAHAAATSANAHYVAERVARGGIGQAGVTAQPFEAWIDDWRLYGADFDTLKVTAQGDDFSYDLDLKTNSPLVLHGKNGYSVKSGQGQASHYYSQPAYEVSGQLNLPSGPIKVTGHAWLDREWSSQPLALDQKGWDWFSITLENGQRLMAFQLRSDGRVPYTSATWIAADGEVQTYGDGQVTMDPIAMSDVAGKVVPTGWQLKLPDRGVDLNVKALNPSAWMEVSVPYWEGPVLVDGSHAGVGYLEMTGYQ